MDQLAEIARRVEQSFQAERRVLAFSEYLALFATEPARHSRDAARYVYDAFEHFGTEEVVRPWGKAKRYRLFDQAFAHGPDASALIGHEPAQAELSRIVSNFVREGRPNRLILLHGPNGSAKSTLCACVMRALEHYSMLPEGALYRFHWVFPSQKALRGAIGFGGGVRPSDSQSYAHLPDDQVDARLFVEVRDHPLFLIPKEARKQLLNEVLGAPGTFGTIPSWILNGSLSHKSQQVFNALLASYDGRLDEVLKHVQVQRYFISKRYRVGAVTLGPELSVDAGERQITADRSVTALPPSLQALSLFEVHGELVDAAGGVLEFSDLLKRPLDTFKYLQNTAETGEIALRSQTLQLNCTLLASCNEEQLSAFRQHGEFPSFRGRIELVRMPYLLSWKDEMRIYDEQIVPRIGKRAAPHATEIAAMFAALTRLRRPNSDAYRPDLRSLLGTLTAMEKLDLYAEGKAPARLDSETSKLLRSAIGDIYRESESYPIYEGSTGASPRLMRTVLFDAAQNPRFESLSPLAVLEELDELCRHRSEYAFLQEDRQSGDYHDHVAFRQQLRERLLDTYEDEFRVASGLVDEARYEDLFQRYILQVSVWVKGEKIRNPVTGQFEDPDARVMREVETLMGGTDQPEQLRHALINEIAAWAIDHPGQNVREAGVFQAHLRRIRDAVFAERRSAVAKLCRDLVVLVREDGAELEGARKKEAEAVLQRLAERSGYDRSSAADAGAVLMRERFAALVAS